MRIAGMLGLVIVIVGMINNIPAIPGLDQWVREASGSQNFVIRKFPFQYLYPLVFVVMMVIVALRHSFYRDARDKSSMQRRIALFIDVLLVATAVAVSLAYVTEISSVCLIDQFTGERARLISESLAKERELAELYGLPVPDSVEDPQCLYTLGVWIFAVVGAAMVVFLGYNIKVWGLPLVMVAILIAAYTIGTVLIWYVWGADDLNKYAITKLGGEPRQLIDGRPNVLDILINSSQGLLGRFMDILLNTVFPYLILGALFGASAGGQSLIKLAFLWTCRLRGGPAHAAIVSSALFGTVSGGPVVNVMSTGVLTIPMMLKRGFSRPFVGGVEAAASSGGSIMPPVMGVAAFVLASLTATPYREVIIAALIPALAYFGCLFLSVVFQARKQGIEAVGTPTEDMRMSRTDYAHLVMIVGPIFLIIFLLLTPKEAIGCGPIAALFGVPHEIVGGFCRAPDLPWLFQLVQNSAGDAGSAGWWSVLLLGGLLFMDPKVRAQPSRIIAALSQAGLMISTLYLMFLAVSVIDFCLNFTGLSGYISLDILGWLRSLNIEGGSTPFLLFVALLLTMVLAVLLGMGMPTVPAYINVALLMGPVLAGLGIATFTAHMFIFYFAVASAITPPVAIAAFAAASITKADPMITGFSAVRSGIVMFVIPFVFAFYPELLLIDQAIENPETYAAATPYIAGYDGVRDWPALAWLIARLGLALYLLASALARFDRARLATWEMAVRLAAALAIMSSVVLLSAVGIAIGAALIARQIMMTPASAPASQKGNPQ